MRSVVGASATFCASSRSCSEAASCAIHGRRSALIGNLELRRGAPQALEVVIPARLLAEHVHDEISEVKKHPFGGAKAFAVAGRAADARKLFFHFLANGVHLRRAESGTDDEIVGERAEAAQVQEGDSGGFLILRRFDGEPDYLG